MKKTNDFDFPTNTNEAKVIWRSEIADCKIQIDTNFKLFQ